MWEIHIKSDHGDFGDFGDFQLRKPGLKNVFFHDSISEQSYGTFEMGVLREISLRIFHFLIKKTKDTDQ